MVVSFNPSSHLRSSGVCLSFSDHYQNDNMGKMNMEYDLARGPVATHQCTPGAQERNREVHWLPRTTGWVRVVLWRWKWCFWRKYPTSEELGKLCGMSSQLDCSEKGVWCWDGKAEILLGRLQPISIIGCNDYIPSCWLSHSRKKLRTGARLRLQVTFIIQRRRLQNHRLPDIETLRGLPGLCWIFCAGNYYNVETSAIQKTSRFFELGYWKHLDVPL